MWLAAALFQRFYKGEPLVDAAVRGGKDSPSRGPFARDRVQYPDPVANSKVALRLKRVG